MAYISFFSSKSQAAKFLQIKVNGLEEIRIGGKVMQIRKIRSSLFQGYIYISSDLIILPII